MAGVYHSTASRNTMKQRFTDAW